MLSYCYKFEGKRDVSEMMSIYSWCWEEEPKWWVGRFRSQVCVVEEGVLFEDLEWKERWLLAHEEVCLILRWGSQDWQILINLWGVLLIFEIISCESKAKVIESGPLLLLIFLHGLEHFWAEKRTFLKRRLKQEAGRQLGWEILSLHFCQVCQPQALFNLCFNTFCIHRFWWSLLSYYQAFLSCNWLWVVICCLSSDLTDESRVLRIQKDPGNYSLRVSSWWQLSNYCLCLLLNIDVEFLCNGINDVIINIFEALLREL